VIGNEKERKNPPDRARGREKTPKSREEEDLVNNKNRGEIFSYSPEGDALGQGKGGGEKKKKDGKRKGGIMS